MTVPVADVLSAFLRENGVLLSEPVPNQNLPPPTSAKAVPKPEGMYYILIFLRTKLHALCCVPD